MEYEKTMKDLLCDALMSGDKKKIETVMRSSIHAIASIIATSKDREMMEEFYAAVGKSIWGMADEMFYLIDAHRDGPILNDPAFAKFMVNAVRGQENG